MASPTKTNATKTLTLRTAGVELLFLFLAMIVPPVVVFYDLVHLEWALDELSFTEQVQQAFLMISCVLFALGARRHADKRGYLWMVAIFLFILVIREHDFLFDMIDHGFWKYPALVTLIIGIFVVRAHKDTVRAPFLAHFDSRGFAYAVTGLFVLIFFSRLFGSSAVLRDALGDLYAAPIKTMFQEGIELLGYSIMLLGSVVSFRTGYQSR